MSHAIRIKHTGGPEVMQWMTVTVGAPGPGEVRIRNTAIGLNFIDCYHRSGLYALPLPSGLGMEAVGVVEALGRDVEGLRPGDRVATIGPPVGAYAEQRLMPAARVVRVPDGVDDRTAAAAIFKGLTAHYLIFRTWPVKSGERILVHAAAGGVGQILCQWARQLGATVIGTVGSEEKAALALSRGCHHVINYNREDFARRVREITHGEGVDVVYDSVGQATFEGSLDCLRPMGLLASFGNASGPVPPFDPLVLMKKGSLYFTRASLMDYTKKREDLVAGASAVFEALAKGIIRVEIGQTYPLREAAQAHADLEARKTTGSTLLIP
ncbi:MAG TPA: quinone oxidoreductase [Nevskiales bacterium]|nr:quinone oxidoreductase [Nevskiales bacterium]